MSGDMHNKYCQVSAQNCKGIHDNGGHCQFDLWGPDRHTSVGNLAFSAYAFHQQQIEEFISYLAAADDPDDTITQMEIAAECSLNLDDLTEDERFYIARCVNDIREANT